jgi:transposase
MNQHRNKHNQKRRKKYSSKKQHTSFAVMNPNAAGIDVGSAEHWVAVPEDRDNQPVRSFTCFTADLHAMADWLKTCAIQTVVMESTGVYWIPLYQLLERQGFDVKLVNARHVKNVPGRKTDVSDCQWLQRLHTYGLLSGSFRPEDSMCVLRSFWRHRDTLVRYTSSHVQHMHKALTEMNIQLHKVISDITGLTGMRIIRAILAGERDPVTLAHMRDHRIKSSAEQIAKALEGDYRQEHLFALQQAVELYDVYQEKIQACDRQIEHYLTHLDSKIDLTCNPLPASTKRNKTPKGNTPHFDLRTHLYRISGADFTQIDGLDVVSVHTILSEVGLDPTAFPTEKHFSSWLGLSPNNRITGGKIKSSKTRKVINRAANAFRMAAQSLTHSSSALGGYYRRMSARLDGPQAITATAHKLARIFYHLWKNGGTYHDPGVLYYEQKYKQRVINNMIRKGKQLGFQINIELLNGLQVS